MLFMPLIIACNSYAQEPIAIDEELLTDLKKEEEILKALDEINKQLDLIEMDKNQQQLLNKKSADIEQNIELIEDVHQVPLLEDSLKDLDIDQALSEELELIEDWPSEQLDQAIEQKGLKSSKAKELELLNLGEEELIIHQLDKSELMNIDKELELLKKKADIKPPLSIEKELYEY